MSEILTFDTESSVIKTEVVEDLPVYGENHPLLRKKIPEYNQGFPSPILKKLIKRLITTRKKFGGIGLSANQCGISERVFVIGTDTYDLACVNPKVINQSEEIVRDKEGCLSFPAFVLTVGRPSWIEVEFLNEDGELQRMKMDGITARCFLHELDHLDGIRFTDRVGAASIQMARKKQQKIINNIKKRHKGLTRP